MKIKRYKDLILYHDRLLRLYDEYRLIHAYLFERKRLVASKLQSSSPPFFIIGSGRSGNTLLRAILAKHPAVVIPPESYVLGQIVRTYRVLSFLPWPELSRIVISKFEDHPQFFTWEISLQEFYERIVKFDIRKQNLSTLLNAFYMYYAEKKKPSAIRWGDKTPLNTFHLQRIRKVFPEAKFVHIIRDGRDVVSSYLKAGIYQKAEDAAKRWLSSIRLAQRFARQVGEDRYLEIRYEQLVKDPETSVKKVCRFIDLEYRDEMLRFYENIEALGDTKLKHHENLHNPINQESVGKWRANLNESQKLVIERMLKKELVRLGYMQ